MTENMTQEQREQRTEAVPATATPVASAAPRGGRPQRPPRGRGGASGRGGGSPRKGGQRGGFERARPEFDSKMIQIRRVTRVVAGGRRFAFSVAVVAGNRKGSVGVGIGKAGDTATAIDKAMKNAKKNMLKVVLSKEMMIPHYVEAKASSACVMIMPAPGRGMVAGSSVRNVLELAGIKNVRGKILSGSKNKLNNARAAVKALGMLRTKKVIAMKQ